MHFFVFIINLKGDFSMQIEGIIVPKDHKSSTTLIETEIHIKKIKDFFEKT